MIRVLFGILAIAFVVMALLFEIPTVYLILIGLALVAIGGGAVVALRNQREKNARSDVHSEEAARDDLRSLGIMDIRPRESNTSQPTRRQSEAAEKVADEPVAGPPVASKPAPTPEKTVDSPQQSSPERTESSPQNVDDPMKARPKKSKKRKKAPAEPPVPTPEAKNGSTDESWSDAPAGRIFHPLLSSLKEALDAHTVCLLKQKDLALEYYIEALVSDNDRVHRDHRFVTREPLLTATMAQRPVSVRHVGKSGVPRPSLGYYRDAVEVQQVALAPIPRSEALATHFLVADTLNKDALGSQYHRTLLSQYAELISTLLDEIEYSDPSYADEDEDVRPRREIIQEEMASAREEEEPLALALVYLNRAEVLADDGLGAVASAERALRRRIDEATPDGRVERFGELTFGIFQRQPLEKVEAWATQLQQDLEAETGILEGGVSIGVAILGERHDSADGFRADATAALQESYQSGACIIVE